MASTVEYLDFVLDLLSEVDEIRYRKMMGEYVLYYRDKVFGGIYDDRFLIKTTDSVKNMLPGALQELNYEGGSMMTVVETEDRAAIAQVLAAMWPELPERKSKRK